MMEVSFYGNLPDDCFRNFPGLYLMDKENKTTNIVFDENQFAKMTLMNETYKIKVNETHPFQCGGIEVKFPEGNLLTPLAFVRYFKLCHLPFLFSWQLIFYL